MQNASVSLEIASRSTSLCASTETGRGKKFCLQCACAKIYPFNFFISIAIPDMTEFFPNKINPPYGNIYSICRGYTEQRLPSFLFPYFFEQWSSLHFFHFTEMFFPYIYICVVIHTCVHVYRHLRIIFSALSLSTTSLTLEIESVLGTVLVCTAHFHFCSVHSSFSYVLSKKHLF